MCITPLTLQECTQAASLHQAAFYKGWTEKDFRDFIEDPLVFSLKIQQSGNFCGYILWREIEDEAEILTLVIAPSFQRKGMGNLLLTSLFERLKSKGISKLFLEVAEDNKSARSFYIKNGFTIVGKRPNYYERAENKLVDALNLFKILSKKNWA